MGRKRTVIGIAKHMTERPTRCMAYEQPGGSYRVHWDTSTRIDHIPDASYLNVVAKAGIKVEVTLQVPKGWVVDLVVTRGKVRWHHRPRTGVPIIPPPPPSQPA